MNKKNENRLKIKTAVFVLILAGLVSAAALSASSKKASPGAQPKQNQKMNYKLPLDEVMTYDVKALGITLGSQENTTRGVVDFNGRRAVNVISRIKTSQWVRIISLDNSMETFIDIDTLKPLKYEEKSNEKDWKAVDTVFFFPGKMAVTTLRGDKLDKVEKTEAAFAEWPQDEFSMIYFVRHLPLEVGKTFKFNSCVDNELKPATVKVVKLQEIKTPFGKKEVLLVTSTIGEAKFLIGNDDLKIPYQFEVKLNIGGMKGILKKYSPELSKD
jgi:hypothetical protein